MSDNVKCLRPRVARWALHVCCNDPDSGGAMGYVNDIRFGIGRGNFDYGTDWIDDHELALNGAGVTFRWLDANHFRLGRYKFRCLGQRAWVGNWCWDGCFIVTNDIRKIARILKAKGWTVEEGSQRLCRWWESLPQ